MPLMVYLHDGTKEELPSYFSGHLDHPERVPVEDMDKSLRNAIAHAGLLLQTEKVEILKIADGGFHDILQVAPSDYDEAENEGKQLVIRIRKKNCFSQDEVPDRFASEVSLLQLLHSAPSIPCPRIHKFNLADERKWMLMDRLKGTAAVWISSETSDEKRERMLLQTAFVQAELFRTRTMFATFEGIGCVGSDLQSMGFIAPGITLTKRIFEAEELFEELITYWENRNPFQENTSVYKAQRDLAHQLLAQLRSHAHAALLFEPMLLHLDNTTLNTLCDPLTGDIESIIDWEFHAVVPSFLAVSEPEWILYEGYYSVNELSMRVHGWESEKQQAAHWRRIFREEISKSNSQYLVVLDAGRTARQLFIWLLKWRVDMKECIDAYCEWAKGLRDLVVQERQRET
ncbi:hypothetical protein BT69DRAFT_1281469 [Atractiella rhizophila]|nr:hypothetical protein BT69DRAFT_1281469 [Atractiella rhizophila]